MPRQFWARVWETATPFSVSWDAGSEATCQAELPRESPGGGKAQPHAHPGREEAEPHREVSGRKLHGGRWVQLVRVEWCGHTHLSPWA